VGFSFSPGERSVTANNPRVVHLVPALFGVRGTVGGAERYALELARHMAIATPTTLVSFGDRDEDERIGDLRVRTIGRAWLVAGQRANPFSLRVLSELAGADVVHCHQQHVLVSSVAAAVARSLGRRVFCSDLGGGGWDVSAYVSTDPWYHGHLHISDYSRRVAGHERRSNAWVIYGGVDGGRFCPSRAVARESHALFVGRILPHKGLDDLVDAAAPDLTVRVVGPAPRPAYLERLRAMAAAPHVSFHHDLSDEALVDEYRRAACVVLPSVYRDRDGHETAVPELLGQTLLEAMACGTPVVCTRVASLPEVVEHGVTGLIVRPNDPATLGTAIRWLRDHPADAARMGAAGRTRVRERFNWPGVVRQCLAIYGGIAARDRSLAEAAA
jgi:glycosyltransferase involved in cell wall biosynthesis